MAAALRVWLVLVDVAVVRVGVVPRAVDVEPREDRAGASRATGARGRSTRPVERQVEVRAESSAARRARRTSLASSGYSAPSNGSTFSLTAPNLRATSSAAFRLVPAFSMNVVGSLVELVGLLRRHPDEALGQQLGVLDAVGLDEVPPQQRVGRGPADARTGRALVTDLPPGLAEILRLRDRGAAAPRSPAASAFSNRQSLSVLPRRHAVENPLDASRALALCLRHTPTLCAPAHDGQPR